MNNIQSVLLGLSLPFMGTVLGAGMVFFMKKGNTPQCSEGSARLCLRRNDCGVCLVADNSFNRNGGEKRQ